MKKKIETHAGTGHQCRECRQGKWNDHCFNWRGEPFVIYCEHGQKGYSPVNACNVTYIDTCACKFFEAGPREGVLP